MKYLILLLGSLLFFNPLFSKNPPSKFSLNLKLSLPFIRSDVSQFNFFIDPGMEALYQFSLAKEIKFETGIIIQNGHYFWNKEVEKLVWVDGFGWHPTEYIYDYNFKYISAGIPLLVDIPVHNSFLNSVNFGINLCWYLKANFYLISNHTTNNLSYNRFFFEPNVGLKIPLTKLNRIAFYLQPFLAYRFSGTNKNDLQKKIFTIGIKLNTIFNNIRNETD